MREIKFRAWQNLQLRMREIKGIDYKSNGEIEYVSVYQKNTAPLTQLYGTKDYPLECLNLMQYTGLKDKNGVEIYEGDIVKDDEYEHIGVVEYAANGFWIKDHSGNEYGWYQDLADEQEVIGNIYEDSNLLKN